MTGPQSVPPVPAVLRLVQMVVLGRWRATGEELYREVAHVIEAAAGQEILVVGCGEGVTTEWLATRTDAHVHGVDPDAERIEHAEERARAMTRPLPLSYQQAPYDDLPHENGVFDATIGEPAIASVVEPARAVQELVRVAKPMGKIVLLQLTWSSDLSASAREMVVERLGLRPHLVVEWKQMLRDAGVVDVQVQDWTTAGSSRSSTDATGKQVTVEPQLHWSHKMQIMGRAWRTWSGGLRGGRDAVERETALLRELSKERAIGFHLISGVKWPHAKAAS